MADYTLSTERLGLRKWKDSDIESFAMMNGDEDVMKFFPKTLSHSETLEMVERIKSHFDRHNFGLYVVEEKLTKQFIGFTGFSIPQFDAFFTPCVEIGWRLKKEFWGRGLATEAANACLKYGFETLNFDKIVSFTSVLNITSEKLMKRIGMTLIGNFEHPNIEKNNPLCRHVLYQIEKKFIPKIASSLCEKQNQY